MKMILYIILGLVLALVIVSIITFFQSNVEEPKHHIVENLGDGIEIREYEPMILAEVSMDSKDAMNNAFRKLFKYISAEKREGPEIPMTAPVFRDQESGQPMRMSFVMPDGSSLEDLPVPASKDVKLREVGVRRYIVIRFSGFSSESNMAKHLEKLQSKILEENLKVKDFNPKYAYYDPPWTLPFLRRNEIMFEIE